MAEDSPGYDPVGSGVGKTILGLAALAVITYGAIRGCDYVSRIGDGETRFYDSSGSEVDNLDKLVDDFNLEGLE